MRANGGVARANDGVARANDSVARANGGVARANDGVARANSGVARANDGVARANGSLARANDGVARANDGVARANDGVARANDGVARANGGVARANDGVARANDGVARANGSVARANDGVARVNDVWRGRTSELYKKEIMSLLSFHIKTLTNYFLNRSYIGSVYKQKISNINQTVHLKQDVHFINRNVISNCICGFRKKNWLGISFPGEKYHINKTQCVFIDKKNISEIYRTYKFCFFCYH